MFFILASAGLKGIYLLISTSSFPHIFDLMAFRTFKLQILPTVDKKRYPKEQQCEKQENENHHPDKRSISVLLICVSFCVTEWAAGDTLNMSFFYDYHIRFLNHRRHYDILRLISHYLFLNDYHASSHPLFILIRRYLITHLTL